MGSGSKVCCVSAMPLICRGDLDAVSSDMSSKKNPMGTSSTRDRSKSRARPDSVRTTLVFLNLLEGQAYGLAQLFLAHAQKRPPEPDFAADVNIYRVCAPTAATTTGSAAAGSPAASRHFVNSSQL